MRNGSLALSQNTCGFAQTKDQKEIVPHVAKFIAQSFGIHVFFMEDAIHERQGLLFAQMKTGSKRDGKTLQTSPF